MSDSELAAEVRALRAEVERLTASYHPSHPRHAWAVRLVARVVKSVQSDPAVQYRVHLAAMWFWFAMTLIAGTVFFVLPGVWAKASIFYIVLISHYANWATDFDGMSSSLAAIHAKRASRSAHGEGEGG